MTTLTIKINEHSKAGKAFLAMSETFFKGVEGIEIIETDLKNTKEESGGYNKAFVEKVLKSSKSGRGLEINPEDIWGSLGLK